MVSSCSGNEYKFTKSSYIKNVQAYISSGIDIGMKYFSEEFHLGGNLWVVFWEGHGEFKRSTFPWCIFRAASISASLEGNNTQRSTLPNRICCLQKQVLQQSQH